MASPRVIRGSLRSRSKSWALPSQVSWFSLLAKMVVVVGISSQGRPCRERNGLCEQAWLLCDNWTLLLREPRREQLVGRAQGSSSLKHLMDVTSLKLVPLTLYSDQLIKLELSCAKEPWEKLLCNADKNLFSFKLRILCFLFLQGVVMWCKTSRQ